MQIKMVNRPQQDTVSFDTAVTIQRLFKDIYGELTPNGSVQPTKRLLEAIDALYTEVNQLTVHILSNKSEGN